MAASAPIEIRVPNRFESLQETFGQEIRPLIVPIDTDLHKLNSLADRARVQNGGLLVFLLGGTGVGKTTCVHSAAVHMPDAYAPVVSVPPQIAIREAAGWLESKLPPPTPSKTTLVLFDGREISDDAVGVRQLLAGLNQVLRRRSDILFCWPTTDEAWHEQLRGLAENIGGANFAPPESDLLVDGPPPGEWPTVLERLLLQFGKTYADLGLGPDLIGTFCGENKTLGDFLGHVGMVIAERVTKTRVAKKLPQIVFVVTSSADVVGEANRIRRAGTQALAPEPLLGHSPRSEAGKWWTERNKNPDHHLGYVISLFDARLVTMTPSAVVYGCLHFGEPDFVEAATKNGARPDKGNARRTVEVSEFYRFLKGEQIPEFTTGKKGGLQDATRNAYAELQAMSQKRHKALNQALCGIVRENLPDLKYDHAKDFEVAQGGDVITDAIVSYAGHPYSLEFHHLSEAQCGAANIASYIMQKLRLYAWYHQIIPR